MDEIEKFVNGGGGREVPNIDGTTSSGVGSTESDLEGSGRILCLFLTGCQIIDRIRGSIKRNFYLEGVHLVIVWESPHSSENVHAGKTHA